MRVDSCNRKTHRGEFRGFHLWRLCALRFRTPGRRVRQGLTIPKGFRLPLFVFSIMKSCAMHQLYLPQAIAKEPSKTRGQRLSPTVRGEKWLSGSRDKSTDQGALTAGIIDFRFRWTIDFRTPFLDVMFRSLICRANIFTFCGWVVELCSNRTNHSFFDTWAQTTILHRPKHFLILRAR